jgi:uncharacterized protein YkwD
LRYILFASILLTIFAGSEAFAQQRSGKPQPILVADIGAGGRARSVVPPKINGNSPLVVRDSNYGIERSTFEMLNSERAALGLRSLVWDENVAKLARLHSRNMANQSFFSHRGLDGSTVDGRADQLGMSNWSAIAENIAFLKGHNDPASLAIQKWLKSPSHRRNILGGGWERSAVGVAIGDDGAYYFTQVFISGN